MLIGKLFTDAGLKDLIVQSGLLEEDQASQMLKENDYNNGIPVHIYLAEAINRIKMEAFENRLVTRNRYRIYDEMKENGNVQIFKQSRNTENFECCVEVFRPLLVLHEEFEQFFSNPEQYRTLWDLKMEIGICTSTHLRKFYIGFMFMTTITTQDTCHTTGLHSKLYLNIIQQYVKNLKVIFLFDMPLVNSTKYPLIKLFRRP